MAGMGQRLFSGFGSNRELSAILRRRLPRKILLVTGGRSYDASGARRSMERILRGHDWVRFQCSRSTPDIVRIKTAVTLCRRVQADFIIAVGGGSVLDLAKSVSLLSPQPEDPAQYLRGRRSPRKRKIPLAAVPTTAGSGSEATHFAVVYLGKRKHSLSHASMVPDFAVLDPMFLASLPRREAAASGADALCQAIESMWSVNSTAASRRSSRKAVRLALKNLLPFVRKRAGRAAGSMLLASHLAGRAIDVARTTGPHAVSYPLTARYGIAHGQAVALTLPYFLELNAEVSPAVLRDTRGMPHIRRVIKELLELLGAGDPASARRKLVRLMRNAGLETRLSGLGLGPADLDVIVKHGHTHERLKNNPRAVTKGELRAMLRRIL